MFVARSYHELIGTGENLEIVGGDIILSAMGTGLGSRNRRSLGHRFGEWLSLFEMQS
jgi:hypothetical protein